MGIYLRPLEVNDYHRTWRWRNDPDVTDQLAGTVFYVSPDREKKWLEHVVLNDENQIRRGIVSKENEELVGMVNLVNIDWINKNAEFSILIGEKNEWGKGYGKKAMIDILNFGFFERNLERVYLYVNVGHDRAISLYEKFGFKKEGRLRNHHFRKGRYRDVFLYSILKEEYV